MKKREPKPKIKKERTWMCWCCKEVFTKADIRCWKQLHEDFYTHPLICPDCLDTFNHLDEDEKIQYLMNEAHIIGGSK